MFPAFGVGITCDVLYHIQNADMDTAFWLINKEQANLHHEKAIADQTLALLRLAKSPRSPECRTPQFGIGKRKDYYYRNEILRMDTGFSRQCM